MTEMVPLRQDREASQIGGSDLDEEDDESCVSSVAPEGVGTMILWLLVDIAASAAFWSALIMTKITDRQFNIALGVIAVLMLLWRIYRASVITPEDSAGVEIPYTSVMASANGKELFLVATVHISPRAGTDVKTVIEKSEPDIAMIELDDERLDRMRDVPEVPPEPKKEDLQPIKITVSQPGKPELVMTVYAQRADWNAEFASDVITGEVFFDEEDAYGLGDGEQYVSDGSSDSHLSLVLRGGPEGRWAPFALKAYKAANAGASAVLVIDRGDKLPLGRLGKGTVAGDLRIALQTCSCGFPPVPVLLLPKDEGNKLLELCKSDVSSKPLVEFTVLDDSYPRRTLARRLCQTCALFSTGIGILYGVIQCFAVEVGGEFLAAELAAQERGIPCVCIDVDLNRFWSRLGWALLPTPCNLLKCIWSWLAFPRVAFLFLFPPRGNVDVLGSMFLHGAAFPLRHWVAFIIAGMCASFVMNKFLFLISTGAEKGAEQAGAVEAEDAEDMQVWILFFMELYMLPQIYDAVANSRDERMYRAIVTKCRHFASRRMVVVVGAGHSNGILQRIRSRGL
eukprot:TRINITY_DN110362_c0_g1_i1.p1 TRINITY_DN110362_c0_g1~~TRINITY_DN110362_c0_g1_i1.p1  ORF type:complete len:567 (+),score=95.85 TRINITY_DN110362_c0_g1_i1:79-1779(+)